MEKTVYLVSYEGNHTGTYYNEVIGIFNSEEQANKMINDLIEEDKKLYPEFFSNVTCEANANLFHSVNTTIEGKQYTLVYKAEKKKVFVNEIDKL